MPWWDIVWYYRSETAPSVEVLGADEGSCISQRGNIAMWICDLVVDAAPGLHVDSRPVLSHS